MEKSSRIVFIGMVGVFAVIVTLSIFFLSGFERTVINGWALFFVLLSELSLFGGLAVLGNIKSRFSRTAAITGITAVLFLYLMVSVASCFFAELFHGDLNAFLTFEFTAIAAAAAVIALILVFFHHFNLAHRKATGSGEIIQLCEDRIYNLLAGKKNPTFEKPLVSLYEKIRYSDKIGSSSVDGKIVTQISRLEQYLHNEGKTEEVNEIINEIIALMEQRKMEISMLKRGL